MSIATLLATLIFIPLLLVSDIVGLFFKQLAFVLVVTYIISQLIAVFLTPIIAFIALPKKKEDKKPDMMDAMVMKYKSFLSRSMRYAWISIPMILLGFGLSFYLYKTTPSTFLPKWDEGNIVVDIVLPPGTSLKESQKEFTTISQILDNLPEVDQWTMRIGTSLGHISTQPNEGDFLVTLKKDRHRSSFAIIEDLRQQIEAKVPNLEELGISQVLEDRLGDIMGAEAPIAVMLFSTDSDELMKQGYRLKELLKPIKGVEEVNVLTSYASPSINIHLKPDAKAIYGIDEKSLIAQIRTLYYGKSIASIAQGEKLINIIVLMSHTDRDPIDYLKKELLIYSPMLRKSIPLFEVADISYTNRVAEVTYFNLSPVCILGIRFMGDNMSDVVQSIKNVLTQANLPSNISTDISGFYKEQKKSFEEMIYVIIFAILTIFIGLLLHFSNIRIAFNILIAMVLTLSGIFLALKLTDKPLDITAFMGMLIVLSIVINNNVLIYDFYKMHTHKDNDEIKRLIDAIGVVLVPFSLRY